MDKQLAKASALALVSMIVIVVTVITQGFRVPPESRGEIKSHLLINAGFFQAVGVISFGKYHLYLLIVEKWANGFQHLFAVRVFAPYYMTVADLHRPQQPSDIRLPEKANTRSFC